MQLTPIILGGANPLSARLALAGNYFRLVICPAAVTVRLYKNLRPFAEAPGILAGYWAKPDTGFDEVEIISATPQTVYVGTIFGLGGYDRNAGDVNITGNVGTPVSIQDSVGNPITGASANGFLGITNRMVAVIDGGFGYGATYTSSTVKAANTADQIFAPGSNVNGAILWAASIKSCNAGGAGSNQAAVLAKTSAPANVADGDSILMSDESMVAAGFVANGGRLARSVRIPAGKGLYFISTVLETEALRSALYTLL